MYSNYLESARRWENLTLSNRFLFYKIFTHNLDVCKQLLEILLHIEIDHIEPPSGETVFDVDFDSKGIRLDVYTKADGRRFDLEMQTVDTGELPKRARYYQGLMDIDTLKAGELYSKLPDSYVIFLCFDDIFNEGLPVYTFENRCNENHKIKMNDGTFKVFFNARKYDKMPSEEEKLFFKFLKNGMADSDFTRKLDSLVKSARHNAEWRHQFMTWEQEVNLSYERGVEKGKQLGIQEGIKESIKKLLQTKELSEEKIAELLQVPLETVRQIHKDCL